MAPRLLLTIAAAAVVLGACGPTSSSNEAAAGRKTRSPPAAAPTDPPATETIQLDIVIDDLQIRATLQDTAAARDLLAQLPLTVSMTDHGGVEKTGHRPRPLSLTDQPRGADPDQSDLGYYAPSQDLVLYYGDQSYYPGIVILGRLHGDVEALARTDGNLNVQVRRSIRARRAGDDEL